jgi:hypothetical protein
MGIFTVVPPPTSHTSNTSHFWVTYQPILDEERGEQYLKQLWKFTSSMYSCCFRLGQPNIYPMVGIAAKPSSLNRRPKSLDSGNRLPSCRYAEDEFDICIFPPVRELALQFLLNCLI